MVVFVVRVSAIPMTMEGSELFDLILHYVVGAITGFVFGYLFARLMPRRTQVDDK